MRLNYAQNHQQATRRRTKRNASIAVEALEGRALLSGLHGLSAHHVHAPMMNAAAIFTTSVHHKPLQHHFELAVVPDAKKLNGPSGVVKKRAHFYEFYTGTMLSELNAVGASGKLSRSGTTFTFTGTVKGKINNPLAVYVWGIDRSGNLSPGPFQGRPNIKFDSVVVVSLDSSLTPTATVINFTTFSRTTLPAGSAQIHGKKVSVTVPASLLPSTGLAPTQYRFNFWPDNMTENGVASFVPESSTVQVGRGK
jgi:hypothetical protein